MLKFLYQKIFFIGYRTFGLSDKSSDFPHKPSSAAFSPHDQIMHWTGRPILHYVVCLSWTLLLDLHPRTDTYSTTSEEALTIFLSEPQTSNLVSVLPSWGFRKYPPLQVWFWLVTLTLNHFLQISEHHVPPTSALSVLPFRNLQKFPLLFLKISLFFKYALNSYHWNRSGICINTTLLYFPMKCSSTPFKIKIHTRTQYEV